MHLAESGAREVAAAACQMWRAAVKKGAVTFELWAGNSPDTRSQTLPLDLILRSTSSRSNRLTLCAVTRRAPTTQHSPPARPARRRPPHADPSAMQSPDAAAPHRLHVRLSGALAALLGHAESAERISEESLLGRLREAGLINYPSPLLGALLERLPEVLAAEVLPQLDPADRAVVAQVGRPWLAAVVASGLPLAGKTAGVPLKVEEFVGSVGRLAWAKANGCSWTARTSIYIVRDGLVEVLKWARERDCPWNEATCLWAASLGDLVVLKWAREHGCPWDAWTCAYAAMNGHLELLQWAWARDCPWNEKTCRYAALKGQFEVLQWARERGCPWNHRTCEYAAEGGHLEVLRWAHEHGCPWDGRTIDAAQEVEDDEIFQYVAAHGCPMEYVEESESEGDSRSGSGSGSGSESGGASE